MNYVPIVIFLIVIVGLVAYSGRARRRQAAAQQQMADSIGVGTDVMTTSGLHGTVVARHDDGTVTLSIAPGVEVKWELAALRDLQSLPERYRDAHTRSAEVDDASASPGVELDKRDPGRNPDSL